MVVPRLQAGDIIVAHSFLAHGTSFNTTDVRRDMIFQRRAAAPLGDPATQATAREAFMRDPWTFFQRALKALSLSGWSSNPFHVPPLPPGRWRGNPRRRGKKPSRIAPQVSDHDLKSERVIAWLTPPSLYDYAYLPETGRNDNQRMYFRSENFSVRGRAAPAEALP